HVCLLIPMPAENSSADTLLTGRRPAARLERKSGHTATDARVRTARGQVSATKSRGGTDCGDGREERGLESREPGRLQVNPAGFRERLKPDDAEGRRNRHHETDAERHDDDVGFRVVLEGVIP